MKKPLFHKPRFLLNSKINTAFLVAGAVLVVLVVFRLLFPAAFLSTTAGLFSFGTSVTHSLDGVVAVFSDRAKLTERIAQLSLERDTLYSQTAILTERLHSQSIPDDALVVEAPVRLTVVARPPVTAYDVLVLSGNIQTLSPGAYVYSLGGVPLGVMREVGVMESQAVLFSEPGRVTKALVGDTDIPVDLLGRGAGAYTGNAPTNAGVKEGDTVYVFAPDKRPIGVVSSVVESPSSPEALIHVRTYTNVFSLSYVLVSRP